MTGPEFALSVIASMLAAVIYDILRNPTQPVPKQESSKLLHDSRELFKKLTSRFLPSKKVEAARPTEMPENVTTYGRETLLKKVINKACADFHADSLRMLIPNPTNTPQRAFLKTSPR